MEIIWHMACSGHDEIQPFLRENQIKYEYDEANELFDSLITLDISERHPAYTKLREHVDKLCGWRVVWSYVVRFTTTELQEAQWLTVDSHINKVELVHEDITFSRVEFYDGGKARHSYLSGKPFYVSKPLKHTKRQHIFSSYDATSSLFCTSYAKQIMEEINNGIEYEPVLRASTDQPVGDLSYMKFRDILPKEAIDLSNIERIFTCPTCQKQTYLPPKQLCIDKKYLSDKADFYKTAVIFSYSGHYIFRKNIISQRAYQVMMKNCLTRGLEFRPIQLV